MKINKFIKYFLSVALFSVIIYLTFDTIFSHNDVNDIVKDISVINIKYVLICIGLIILYFLLQGIYMKRNLKLLNKNIGLSKGIFYSIVEFFFSGITPSSTGGQPVQLYYMNKDKIPKKKALITLLINTIYFKLIIAILGIVIFIFKYKAILALSPLFIFFYLLGVVVDLFMVIGGYLLLYKPSILKKILQIVEKIIQIFLKNYDMEMDDDLEIYTQEVKTLKKHQMELFLQFLITFIQRMCLFSISYVVYRSFGLNEYNYFQIIVIQISVQTAVEFVPLPGGTGVSEYLFSIFFVTTFGSSLASAAMLVTRTFSFYIPLIVCGLILLFTYVKDTFFTKEN